jgi:hypothetical protein
MLSLIQYNGKNKKKIKHLGTVPVLLPKILIICSESKYFYHIPVRKRRIYNRYKKNGNVLTGVDKVRWYYRTGTGTY